MLSLPNYWIYQQSTGLYLSPTLQETKIEVYGYAGHGEGLNNPSKQDIPSVGPIPQGDYLINWATDHNLLGPIVLELIPHPLNLMFKRNGFYIHGDNSKANKSASLGCIILNRTTRIATNNSIYRLLKVVK